MRVCGCQDLAVIRPSAVGRWPASRRPRAVRRHLRLPVIVVTAALARLPHRAAA